MDFIIEKDKSFPNSKFRTIIKCSMSTRRIQSCEKCGSEFTAIYDSKQYCDKCLRKDWRKRHKESGGLTWAESCTEKGICYRCCKPNNNGKSRCDDCLIILNKRSKSSRNKDKDLCFDHYGRVCPCCGESNINFLTMDHINGGGVQHRKDDPTSANLYTWLRKHNFPAEFRTLCYNCNYARGFYGYCPHEKENKAINNSKDLDVS